MNTHKILQTLQVNWVYPVVFSDSVFQTSSNVLAELLSTASSLPAKVLVVIDQQVHDSHPRLVPDVRDYLHAHQQVLVCDPIIVPGGEGVKSNEQVMHQLYGRIAEHKIDRHAYMLVIGGGAVLDAVGYVAATAHRGIRLIRMPTTVLSQNDAGVGVKNGINYAGRKNFLGTFAPPFAVVNDSNFLSTLDERDRRAGMAEAIKVALIKDKTFFEKLFESRFALRAFDEAPVNDMIRRCAELHLDHIANNGDPFELGSARPLDFGHWSAHKLEVMSNFAIRHGEAVACGIVIDALYSVQNNCLCESDFTNIVTLFIDLGFRFDYPQLGELDVAASLEEFREHLGGQLSITMLTGIGSAHEIHDVDVALMKKCMQRVNQLSSAHSAGSL